MLEEDLMTLASVTRFCVKTKHLRRPIVEAIKLLLRDNQFVTMCNRQHRNVQRQSLLYLD